MPISLSTDASIRSLLVVNSCDALLRPLAWITATWSLAATCFSMNSLAAILTRAVRSDPMW